MNRDHHMEQGAAAQWHRALEERYSLRERQAMWRWVRDAHRRAIVGGDETTLEAFIAGRNMLERLKADEPLAYILGETEFYSLPLRVDRSVLIPRPETEELVEWISLEEGYRSNAHVLDIGTGSGCIALALKFHHPAWTVAGSDISAAALAVAAANARALGADVSWIEGNILESFPKGKFDMVVSNPPYIPSSESGVMSPSALAYEPGQALFTDDADGLVFYRRIAAAAKDALNEGGVLYFELNEFHGEKIGSLLREAGYSVTLRKDLQGKVRMARALPL